MSKKQGKRSQDFNIYEHEPQILENGQKIEIKNNLTHEELQIALNLRINYLNTSSTKCILDILEILE